MRNTLALAVIAIMAATGAALAQNAAPDDGRFIMDAPPGGTERITVPVPALRFIAPDGIPQRRDFQRNSPIITTPIIDGCADDRYIGPADLRRVGPIASCSDRIVLAQADIIRETPVITLNGVRVAAVDTEALAEFYRDAFGMVEVQRIAIPGAPEIMLNFGATVEEAQANTNGDVVIYPRESDDVEDPIAHIVFDVSDAAQVAADVETFGGTILRAPFEYGDTGIIITMVADPAGNQIELIQWPVREG
jgi:predicted enzyme related to lactoylglutathione lyase